MDESRKAFEHWISGLPMCSAERHRVDNDRYRFNTTEVAWKSWQASRAAIEIELPSLKQIDTGERYVWSDGVFNFKEDAIEAIRAAGIKVKE